MRLKYWVVASIVLLSNSCQKETVDVPALEISELAASVDQLILDKMEAEKTTFNWNDQDDAFLCKALPLTDNLIAVGFETNLDAKEQFEQYVQLSQGALSIHSVNHKLGIYSVRISDCALLKGIRNIEGLVYVELDHFPSDLSHLIDQNYTTDVKAIQRQQTSNNPGAYVPGSQPYLNFLSTFDGSAADRAYKGNMDEVYHEMGYYGNAEAGVVVIDNGVREDQVPFFSVGPGGYEADGYFIEEWWDPLAEDDGPYPLVTDWFGIWHLLGSAADHGTGMSKNVYAAAPFAHRRTIRTSPTYILITPVQMHALTNAITDLADDPQIKVISMSMAGPFNCNQTTSAIRYFNSKNKIMVSAAGSSLPVLRDILGVLYPARIPETVSMTGIDNLADHNGNFVLGWNAHGGPQNDFVIEPSNGSSTATSTFAGMLAVVWGINPELDRQEVIDIMINHSNFNLEQGSKHPKFGWGKVDMHQVALDIEATL